MKRSSLFLLFLLYSVFFVFAVDRYEEVPGTGLFIDSVPSGAKVFIDGIERGTTPYRNSSIRIGEYNIRLVKDGYTERRIKVAIRRDSRIEISVDLEEARGQVILELRKDPEAPASLEYNPKIFVDGILLPEHVTPFFEHSLNLPAGWRSILVEAFGWEKLSTRILVEEGSEQKLELVIQPAIFTLTNATLRKKRFNPMDSGNLGNAEVNFTVSAPGMGLLEVFNDGNALVYTGNIGPFTTWQQQITWNGRDSDGETVNDGRYTLRISGWNGTESERQFTELFVQVDNSIAMRPLSIASSVPGLLFASSPEALPAFSYQIDGSLIAGKPLLQGTWKSLPFAISLRVSFMDHLETAVAFNAIPLFSEDYNWGLGASFKWIFSRPTSISTEEKGFLDSFGMAAELSYGWAIAGPYTAFGMGTGLGMRLPLIYRFLQGTSGREFFSFDLLLSPLILWASEKGYPDSFIPHMGIEGGLLFNYGNIAAGLSLRWDYDIHSQNSGPFASALEFKFFPSGFVLSLSGGFWYLPNKKEPGAFLGLGFGIMY